jgi:hypothetical protein
MKLETRIRQSITHRKGTVFSRSDLKKFGSQSQVTFVLSSLIDNGELLRISRGVYAKASYIDGEVKIFAPIDEVIREAIAKLGLQLYGNTTKNFSHIKRDSMVVVETNTPRTNRVIKLNGIEFILRSHRKKCTKKLSAIVPIEQLPRKNIRSFVMKLAKLNNISYAYNSMDQFADSVTSLAGDDVKHDHVEDLLVALKRAGKLSMQQVARLSINYLRERHGSV